MKDYVLWVRETFIKFTKFIKFHKVINSGKSFNSQNPIGVPLKGP